MIETDLKLDCAFFCFFATRFTSSVFGLFITFFGGRGRQKRKLDGVVVATRGVMMILGQPRGGVVKRSCRRRGDAGCVRALGAQDEVGWRISYVYMRRARWEESVIIVCTNFAKWGKHGEIGNQIRDRKGRER